MKHSLLRVSWTFLVGNFGIAATAAAVSELLQLKHEVHPDSHLQLVGMNGRPGVIEELVQQSLDSPQPVARGTIDGLQSAGGSSFQKLASVASYETFAERSDWNL